MQAISVIGNGVSILFLAIIAFSSLSWQNPAKVRTALVHFTEPGDELSISLEIQLVLPLSEQVADQTPLIPSTFENDSNLSLELHSIATILLNLNLASRSGLAKPSKISSYINKTTSRYQHVFAEHEGTKPFSDLFTQEAIITDSNTLIKLYNSLFAELSHRDQQGDFTEQEHEELWNLVYVSKLSMTDVFDLTLKLVPDQKDQAESLEDEVKNLFGDF